MKAETKRKLEEIEEVGYSILQPNNILYHVFTPNGKACGIFGSKAEAIKHAYRIMKNESM